MSLIPSFNTGKPSFTSASLAKLGAIVAMAVLIQYFAIVKTANADIVYDTYSDSANFEKTGFGAGNLGGGLGQGTSILESAAGIRFLGDGQEITTIGIVWQYGSDAGLNIGDVSSLNWRAALFLNPGDFTIEGLLANPGFTQPDFFHEFSNPLPGYDDVIESSQGIDNHFAEVDLSGLGFRTIAGQESLAFLFPRKNTNLNGLQAGLALSDNSGVTTGAGLDGLLDEGNDSRGAEIYTNYGYAHNNAAGIVRTAAVPEPSSMTLLSGVFIGVAFIRRRRKPLASREAK